MAKFTIAPHALDRLLNHVSGYIRGIAAVYNQHAALEERKTTLGAWSRQVLLRRRFAGREVMVDMIWGTTTKPVSSKRLAERLEGADTLTGTLYVGYPILGTPSGPFPFDAILLSPQHGVIIFDTVEGVDLGDYRERQDDFLRRPGVDGDLGLQRTA